MGKKRKIGGRGGKWWREKVCVSNEHETEGLGKVEQQGVKISSS